MDRSDAIRELVLRARRGDRGAMTELMTQAVPMIAAVLKALAPWESSREDLIQEALLRAMTHLGAMRDPARFGAYINEIARNLAFDVRRRNRAFAPLPVDPPARGDDPLDDLVRREEESRLRQALSELNELDRQVVLMRHWADASYEEIAGTLGLTVSAVQSRLFRARRRLAECLEEGHKEN